MTDPSWGLSIIFSGFDSQLIGRETINIPEIFSGVHGFTGPPEKISQPLAEIGSFVGRKLIA